MKLPPKTHELSRKDLRRSGSSSIDGMSYKVETLRTSTLNRAESLAKKLATNSTRGKKAIDFLGYVNGRKQSELRLASSPKADEAPNERSSMRAAQASASFAPFEGKGEVDTSEETEIRRTLSFEAQVAISVPNECERTRLIREISTLLREPMVPAAARAAGLTFIGWLARRLPHETPHELGVDEARTQTERRIRSEKRCDSEGPKSDREPKSRRGR